MVKLRPALSFLSLILALVLTACLDTSPAATPDAVATETAIAFAVVSTLTAQAPSATSTPVPDSFPTEPLDATVAASSSDDPAATEPPPTAAPPTPTPTPPLFDVLPVDGDSGNASLRGQQDVNEGRYVVIPNVPPGSLSTNLPEFREWLAFLVEPFDPAVGNRAGDGIRQVNFTIVNEDQGGEIVYTRTEQTVAFCAFGGGEPDCNVFVFSQNDFRWPEGPPLENANYRAIIEIVPYQGESATWNWDFALRDLPVSPQPTHDEIVAEIGQIGWQSLDPVVTTDLVFQVRAYHPAYGSNDGDGIDYVAMLIRDSHGDIVYQKIEQNAAYCAFGGGEPQCERLPLNQIGSGSYLLQAIVYAVDGATQSIETEIEVP